jgi:hypothetical protein
MMGKLALRGGRIETGILLVGLLLFDCALVTSSATGTLSEAVEFARARCPKSRALSRLLRRVKASATAWGMAILDVVGIGGVIPDGGCRSLRSWTYESQSSFRGALVGRPRGAPNSDDWPNRSSSMDCTLVRGSACLGGRKYADCGERTEPRSQLNVRLEERDWRRDLESEDGDSDLSASIDLRTACISPRSASLRASSSLSADVEIPLVAPGFIDKATRNVCLECQDQGPSQVKRPGSDQILPLHPH